MGRAGTWPMLYDGPLSDHRYDEQPTVSPTPNYLLVSSLFFVGFENCIHKPISAAPNRAVARPTVVHVTSEDSSGPKQPQVVRRPRYATEARAQTNAANKHATINHTVRRAIP